MMVAGWIIPARPKTTPSARRGTAPHTAFRRSAPMMHTVRPSATASSGDGIVERRRRYGVARQNGHRFPLRPSRTWQLGENRRRRRQRKAGARYLLQGLLVCRSCGYALCGRWKAALHASGPGYSYYRCNGTNSHRFAGQRRCDATPLAMGPLDAAVWAEVCRLLENPAQVAEEYHRRLQAVRSEPDRPELETIERQLGKLRAGTGRLIDSYAEGVIPSPGDQLG